jgi:hypothetical protein
MQAKEGKGGSAAKTKNDAAVLFQEVADKL